MIIFSDNFSIFYHPTALSVLIMGVSIGLWALNHNKLGNFNVQPKHKEGSYLVTTGIYGLIRHPMYTSVIVMMFSFVMATPTWIEGILFILLVCTLILKAQKEEVGLSAVHPEYQAYRKKTKYFIPYIL